MIVEWLAFGEMESTGIKFEEDQLKFLVIRKQVGFR